MKSDSSDDDKEGGEEGGDRYSDSMRSLFGDEETGGVGEAFELLTQEMKPSLRGMILRSINGLKEQQQQINGMKGKGA